MTDIELLARRVEALEEAQLDARISSLEVAARHNAKQIEWMATTLGKMAATQDQHTARFDRLENEMSSLRNEMSSFRRELPGIVAETMREVLKEGR